MFCKTCGRRLNSQGKRRLTTIHAARRDTRPIILPTLWCGHLDERQVLPRVRQANRPGAGPIARYARRGAIVQVPRAPEPPSIPAPRRSNRKEECSWWAAVWRCSCSA